MSAATWPTFSLSIPFTTIRVGVGTSKITPSGASTVTGWEKPSASSSAEGPRAMAR